MFSLSSDLIFFFTLILTVFVKGNEINLQRERSYPTPVKDSYLLPELVESLAKQKNSPSTSSAINQYYDYIIVGAGAAGSVVASRLSEVPCISVLLLEAGPSLPHLDDVMAYEGAFWFTDMDWTYLTTPQRQTGEGLKNRQVIWPAGKGLGGTTILNSGIHIRGNKKNFDDWAAMGAEGWSYKEVLPYFKKLEDNMNFQYFMNGYHGIGGPVSVENQRYINEITKSLYEAITAMGYKFVDPNSERQTGFHIPQLNLRRGQRCSTAKAYLVPVENRTNLQILPKAFVRKVIIENGVATGVAFDYCNVTFQVRANREVILSAGAIRTPQLLMLSGVGPEEQLRQFKIPVHANLPVGRNLHDHGGMTVYFALKPPIQELSKKLSNERYIKQYIFSRTGPLNYVDGVQYGAFLRNDQINPNIDFPIYEMYSGESSTKGIDVPFNMKPEVYQQVFKPYENRPAMSCTAQMLQPKSRGSVQLRTTNPYDQLNIDPNYLANSTDMDDLVEGLKICLRIGNRPEMKQVVEEPFKTLYPGCEKYSKNEDAYLRCVLKTVIITLSHYCCTAKMGKFGDPTTVIDPQLRVKYIKGLRVADASVMPKITSGNTGVPAIMIGEKAADLIKETIQCK